MAANKVPGARAANCWDEATARNAREHNYANVLTLGAKHLTTDQARKVVRAFLGTNEGEPRHGRRVAKITDIERRYAGG
jgi:ribose 5-phosphate isomerase B